MQIKFIKNKITAVLIVVLFFLAVATNAQAQQQPFSFTQFMDNLTPLNPAYSLVDNTGSVNTMGRKQWVGVEGAPTTFLFNGNIPFESINSAAGLIVFNDQFSVEHETEANAYFAKAVQLGENQFLSVSINAGVRNYVANYSTLDPTDPEFRNDVRTTRPNIGFGVLYFTDWYYIGISAPELTINTLGNASAADNTSFREHYYFSGALVTDVNEDIKFKPAFLVSYAKGVPLITDLAGTFYMKDVLGLGADYRTTKQLAGIITVTVDAFRIGYSYQFSTASENLGGLNNATHEITLSYRFGEGSTKTKIL